MRQIGHISLTLRSNLRLSSRLNLRLQLPNFVILSLHAVSDKNLIYYSLSGVFHGARNSYSDYLSSNSSSISSAVLSPIRSSILNSILSPILSSILLLLIRPLDFKRTLDVLFIFATIFKKIYNS